MIMEYSNKFNNKIEKIINIEWDMFQNVHNIGGRASCQDDRRTFYIMRGSQFFCWNDILTFLKGHNMKGEILSRKNTDI